MASSTIASGRQVRNFWHATRRRQNARYRGVAVCGGGGGQRPSPSFRVPRGAGAAASHPPSQHFDRSPFSTTASDENVERSDDSAKTVASDTRQSHESTESTAPSTSNSPSSLSHVAELSKARLSALVVSTTAFGFLAAGPAALASASLPTFAAASAGTALCASSAATFNQFLEVERDGRMKRTKNRPLVTGVVSKEAAAGLGCLTGASGGLMLGLGTDPVTTMLGVGNIGLYAGLYTYMKPRSEWNTWVGAVVGAVPPVMGWTAAGGSLMDAEAILLGSTLFLWQFPHFFALNWMYRADYKRGGFAMVAVNDPNGDRTSSLIKRSGWYLASLPFASAALEVTSPMYAVDGGIVLNGYALYMASKFDKDRSNANARKVFLTSLWYLPCAMMLFLLHSRRWHEEVIKDEKLVLKNGEVKDASILVSMQKLMNKIQSKGRDLCMHEAIASTKMEIWVGSESNETAIDGSKCPISLGKVVAESANSSIATKEEIGLNKNPTQEKSQS